MKMKEIGGYIEFETYHNKMLHSDGIKLNCGRNCLAYLIVSRQIRKIALPYFMCKSIMDVCQEYGVSIHYYHVDSSLLPEKLVLEEDEWLYLMNYYGQMTNEQIDFYVSTYKRVIIDFTHDYFHEPVSGIDTIYTCRKFFGVPDGAVLYTDIKPLYMELKTDESYDRMHHLMGRFERTASEFYEESVNNNQSFINAPIRKMSKLTENLLQAVDYEYIKKVRTANYNYLSNRLRQINLLHLNHVEGAFAYPLLLENGSEIRKRLVAKKVYVPTLWSNVLEELPETAYEHMLVKNILPLPCDQRYDEADMEYVCNVLQSELT